jgi:hypothetical protein
MKNTFGLATAPHGSVALSFVIPSEGSAVSLSVATIGMDSELNIAISECNLLSSAPVLFYLDALMFEIYSWAA